MAQAGFYHQVMVCEQYSVVYLNNMFGGGGYFTYKSISALFNYSVFIYLFTYLFIY